MSEHSVTFVPRDPRYIPNSQQIKHAEALARSLFPQADAILPQLGDGIRLFDAGGNFESVTCPGCSAQIELDWWQAAMDADYDEQGFRLQPQTMPCCERSYALHEMTYDWPQAFGKFGLELRNPGVGSIPAESVGPFESALGTSLKVICAHR